MVLLRGLWARFGFRVSLGRVAGPLLNDTNVLVL